jgi:hypothetical protein
MKHCFMGFFIVVLTACTTATPLSNEAASSGFGTNRPHNLMGQNPRFINLSTKDFRLQTNSPAVDAATTWGPKVDLLKNPRPRGVASDLGAYEIR